MYKTIIVDDDSQVRKQLNALLSERVDVKVVECCKTCMEAAKVINRQKPDVVFLKVEMPEITGFELLKNLSKPLPLIIFTSAVTDYAAQAFEYEALDYLQKPFDKDRITKSLNRLTQRSSNGYSKIEQTAEVIPDVKNSKQLNRFIIKQSGEYHLLWTKDIIWIEADGNYSHIITKDRKFMVRCTLKGFSEQLDANWFFRISRSRIVNLEYVVKIKDHIYGNYMVELKNGVSLKMSKNYRHLLEALKNF